MNQEVNTDAFECEGASVTVFFSSEGKHLQECIIDVLNVHMENILIPHRLWKEE